MTTDKEHSVLSDLPGHAERITVHLAEAGLVASPPLGQILTLAEEVGEFVGAARRYYGLARRTDTFDHVTEELADVVITAFVLAHQMCVDLPDAIDAKLDVIYTRGWRNPA